MLIDLLSLINNMILEFTWVDATTVINPLTIHPDNFQKAITSKPANCGLGLWTKPLGPLGFLESGLEPN